MLIAPTARAASRNSKPQQQTTSAASAKSIESHQTIDHSSKPRQQPISKRSTTSAKSTKSQQTIDHISKPQQEQQQPIIK
jgi:hypothetical protein